MQRQVEENSSLKKKVLELEKTKKENNNEIENLKKKILELEKTKKENNNEIGGLKKKVQELENEKNNKIISKSNEAQLSVKLKEKYNEIKKLKKKITDLETLVNNKNINNCNFINDNKELKQLYIKLEKEIEHLNNQLLGSFKYDNAKNSEKLIAVNFISGDQKISFPIIFKSSTLFAEVENIIYKKYKEYGLDFGDDNLFLDNDEKTRRIRTMVDNGFPRYNITLLKNNN